LVVILLIKIFCLATFFSNTQIDSERDIACFFLFQTDSFSTHSEGTLLSDARSISIMTRYLLPGFCEIRVLLLFHSLIIYFSP